jgi:hypothetical protein
MKARRALLGPLAAALALTTPVAASAQRAGAAGDDTVDLVLSLDPCVRHLEARLRDLIDIELRTSAHVDEHAGSERFHARVRCVPGGVLLEVSFEGGDAQAAQALDASLLRGADPARALALSLVELLEPAIAEAEARRATRTSSEDAARSDVSASAAFQTWGFAASVVWRAPIGDHPQTGALRLTTLRALHDLLRVEFGAQVEHGGRRLSLGRVVVTSLAVDVSLLATWARNAVLWAVGGGARVGALLWRGRPNDDTVEGSRLRSAHVDLFVRGVADWYLARRWALRCDLEFGGAVVGSRAAAVANAESTRTAVAGFRGAIALGVVHAF